MKPCDNGLDQNPRAMRQRRETVQHRFGRIEARIGATHFLMKTLPPVASKMALHVLAYNLALRRGLAQTYDWFCTKSHKVRVRKPTDVAALGRSA